VGATSFMLKSLSMHASSAPGIVFVQTLALKNSGDFSAKMQSQMALVRALGIGIGTTFSYALEPLPSVKMMLLLFAPMSFLGILSNYMACKSVPIKTLNVYRMELLLDSVFQPIITKWSFTSSMDTSAMIVEVIRTSLKKNLLTPETIAKKESILWSSPTVVSSVIYRENVRMKDYIMSIPKMNILFSSSTHAPLSYLVLPCRQSHSVNIWFAKEATYEQCLEGFYHAFLCRYELAYYKEFLSDDAQIHSLADRLTKETFKVLLEGLKEKGWIIEKHFIGRERSTQGLSVINRIQKPSTF
jgi:hypothetical protein